MRNESCCFKIEEWLRQFREMIEAASKWFPTMPDEGYRTVEFLYCFSDPLWDILMHSVTVSPVGEITVSTIDVAERGRL